MWFNRRNQTGGSGSTNIQVEHMNVHGLSATEARQIALDVFNANFYKLSEEAAQLAARRAEEMIDKFLSELESQSPESVNNMNDPDLQYVLFNAQMEYARSGDEELGDRLVQLLIERTKEKERTLKQIVLNEAMTVLPKLTESQMNILTFAFLNKRLIFQGVLSHPQLITSLTKYVTPFLISPIPSENDFLHLEYLGCVELERLATNELGATYRTGYSGLFSKGFNMETLRGYIPEYGPDIDLTEKIKTLLIRCLNNSELFQLNAVRQDALEIKAKDLQLSETVIGQLTSLHNNHLMTEQEVEAHLEKDYPDYAVMRDLWKNTYLNGLSLTTVGIALAHANLKNKTDITGGLEIWIQ